MKRKDKMYKPHGSRDPESVIYSESINRRLNARLTINAILMKDRNDTTVWPSAIEKSM